MPYPTGSGAGAADGVRRLVHPAPLSEPVQRASAPSEVTDRLLAAIAIGEFLPGERLPAERTLAQMLGVARSTVHDALHQLRDAGVVEIRLGRSGGAVVRSDWTPESAGAVARTLSVQRPQLGELFDLRRLVEGMIARAAAERRTPDDVRQLENGLLACRRARSSKEAHAADQSIHRAVASATQNTHVLAMRESILATITLGIGIEPYSATHYDQALNEHTELVEAIIAGDVDGAGGIAERHFEITRDVVQRVLDRPDTP
ncbi:FadR family transcriptional regulator [Trebonia kvetii]|uniref:FadR family transcriptional regulator n=1 Tax=Trebonia kvetii TaxID=2480626 RepID=A0A6P2C538_9ACTN|nr:FCD domain-containing protein [Trebonia kvetii]TVZ05271.1 FadR family transcriptional regulator [Trebonia kvetii]